MKLSNSPNKRIADVNYKDYEKKYTNALIVIASRCPEFLNFKLICTCRSSYYSIASNVAITHMLRENYHDLPELDFNTLSAIVGMGTLARYENIVNKNSIKSFFASIQLDTLPDGLQYALQCANKSLEYFFGDEIEMETLKSCAGPILHGFVSGRYEMSSSELHRIINYNLPTANSIVRSPEFIYRLIKRGDFNLLESLITSGNIRPTARNEANETALHLLVADGSHDGTQWLLEKDEVFTQMIRRDPSILLYSLSSGNSDLVTFLYESLGRKQMSTVNKSLIIERALVSGSQWIFNFLWSRLQISFQHSDCLHNAVIQNNTLLVRWLLHHGCSVNSLDKYGFSCLNYAAGIGNLEMLELLKRNGATLNNNSARDSVSPLETAIIHGQYRSVEMLATLYKLSTVWENEISVRNFLIPAAVSSSVHVMEALFNHGFFINATPASISSVLGYAINNGNIGILKWILNTLKIDWSVIEPSFKLAAQMRKWEVVNVLLSYKSDTSDLNESWLMDYAQVNHNLTPPDLVWLALMSGHINIAYYSLSVCGELSTETFFDMFLNLLREGREESLLFVIENFPLLLLYLKSITSMELLSSIAVKNCSISFSWFLLTRIYEEPEETLYFTFLKGAIEAGRVEAFSIVNRLCPQYLQEEQNWSLLTEFALQHGSYEILKYFLTNSISPHLETFSMRVVSIGSLSLLRQLVENKIDVNMKLGPRQRGVETLLICAIENDHVEIVRYILNQGADVTVLSSLRQSAIHYAVHPGRDPAILKALIEAGADPNERNGDGMYALQICKDDIRIFAKLLALGANPALWIKTGFHLLHYAAQEGLIELGKWILNTGVLPDISKKGNVPTPIVIAASSKQLDFVRLLLQYGSDVNQAACTGTILHEAIRGNMLELCKILLENGANVHTKCKNGFSALSLAALVGFLPIVQLLLHFGANINDTSNSGWNLVALSAMTGNIELIRFFVDSGIDVNSLSNGFSPTSLARIHNKYDAHKFLLSIGGVEVG